MAKQIKSGMAARQVAVESLQGISEIVGSTLGPAGRPVLISRRNSGDQVNVSHTKDGFNVLQALNYSEPIQDAVHKLCLQASASSLIAGGDGTTSTTVMAAEFANQLLHHSSNNPQAASRAYRKQIDDAIALISEEAVKTEEAIHKVALTSANGDEELTKYVLEAISQSSAYGTILVEKNPTTHVRYSVDKEYGYQAGQGYNWYMPLAMSINENVANNTEFFMKNTFVIPYNGDITQNNQITRFINELGVKVGKKWNLVLVCYEASETVAGWLAHFNRQNKDINVFLSKTTRTAEINGPFQQLNDIAAFTGAQVVDGASAERWTIEDVGIAESVRIGPVKTYFKGKSQNNWIIKRAEQNAEAARLAPSLMDREITEARNASLTGGCVKLVIGGGLSGDLPERADRADDAIKAAQACLRSGALPGCGASYIRAGKLAGVSEQVQTALASIHTKIMNNYGLTPCTEFKAGQTCYIGEHEVHESVEFLSHGVADSLETVKAVIMNAYELGALVANLGGYSLEGNLEEMKNAKMLKDVFGQ